MITKLSIPLLSFIHFAKINQSALNSMSANFKKKLEFLQARSNGRSHGNTAELMNILCFFYGF